MIYNLDESRVIELTEKYKNLIKEYPIWEKTALIRNKHHVLGVQTFAKKIGYSFPDHDADKFDKYYIPYVLISMGYNRDFKEDIEAKKKADPDMDSFMRWASFTHVTTNKHHPEAWDLSSATVTEKDKESKQVIDATKMSDEYIIEMLCDWSSVGAEKGNSPQSWYKIKKNKWKFSDEQERLIQDMMEKLWPGGSNETAEIKHKERYFNDAVWAELNKVWNEYGKSNSLHEEFSFGEFENTIRVLAKEKENVNNIVGKLTSREYEPTVNLQGVGSLQSLSFLFSPAITNYVMHLLDSIINKNYESASSEKTLKAMNLDKIELGNNYETKATVTNNFINGILKSLNSVNSSKLTNKLLLVNKFISNLRSHARTISDKLERVQYNEDIGSLMKVIGIIKNIVSNRNSFINVLNKTLLLQESNEEVVSEMFLNIYEGI